MTNFNELNKSVEKENKENTKEVKCISCFKIVKVELVPYGRGHVANCPDCGKLAYNGE